MKKNKIKLKHRDEKKEAISKLVFNANINNVMKKDDVLIEEWNNIRNKIKTFYAEKYVDILIEHGELFNRFNELSISLHQRDVYDKQQLKDASLSLKNDLEKLLKERSSEK